MIKRVKVFRSSFVESLRAAISDNADQYLSDDSFVSSLPNLQAKELPIEVPLSEPLQLLLPDASDLYDLENAIRLHKSLRDLTPLQARDPRLWTHLSHVEIWPYMRKRWPIERFANDKAKAKRFVESRYFIPQSQSRALLRNGVARLWWVARMSHDGNRDNPYELTRVLLSSLDITQQILERSLGRAPVIVKAFLEFLQRNAEELLSGGDSARSIIRHLAKALNTYGGVCILDCLSEGEIISFLEAEYARVLSVAQQSEVQTA